MDENERLSDFSEQDHPAWIRLKKMYERGDFDKLDSAVAFVDLLSNLGKAGKLLKGGVVWLSIIIGAYLVFTEWILKSVKKAAGQ